MYITKRHEYFFSGYVCLLCFIRLWYYTINVFLPKHDLQIPDLNSLTALTASQSTTSPAILGMDPTFAALGLPQPPPLNNVDPTKIEEIRRTVYVGNLDSGVSSVYLFRSDYSISLRPSPVLLFTFVFNMYQCCSYTNFTFSVGL